DRYRPALIKAIEWRYTTAAIGPMSLLCTIGLLAGGHMKISFFPPIRADFVSARVTLPRGTPVEQTRAAVNAIATAARAVKAESDQGDGEPAIQHILTATGTQGANARHGASGNRHSESHVGEVVMELTPSEDREIASDQIANMWRERVGPIPDLVELTYSWSRENAGEAVNIRLQGHDIEDLRMASQALQTELRTLGGVTDVSDSFRGGKQEIKLALRPQAETLGLSLDDLARQVRQAFYGEEVQRIQRNRDDVRVMLRYPEEQRRSLSNLENMWIRTPSGDEVPFSSVAKVDIGRGFASIKRTDRQRVISVTADIERHITSPNEVIDAMIEGPLPEILAEYPGMSYSLQGEQREQRRSMSGLASAYIIALFAIYALLAIPLRSYLQPLIIMAVIPFGIVGAIGGHLFMGLFRDALGQLSFMSVVGMVALSGVVVNSSLVMVDFVNRSTKEGFPLHHAIQEAGISRFRPIVLTSLTTFVGLSPLLVETSIQAQYLIPMAISLAYGVLFATLITLFLVPCALIIVEDIRTLLREKLGSWGPVTPEERLDSGGEA
ncbi:MAG: efflux RND transporter permease subunit, partial [Deltaproteobacteria bacterium]|nr:efflux RND transporter permease subunit [Deltaproteobacteria bacterium]